jgi:hypothetical protein
MKFSSARPRLVISVLSGCALLAGGIVGFQALTHSSAGSSYTDSLAASSVVSEPMVGKAPGPGHNVCGWALLRPSYNYHGKTGSYKSGTGGLPTYGKAGTSFPTATAGVVLPTGDHVYPSYKLRAHTVYYLLPGVHVGSFQALTGDAFVGGYWNGKGSTLDGEYKNGGQAFDSNETLGNQPGVTIEYMTIKRYLPDGNAAAINEEGNSGWHIQYNTITLNVPGAGVLLSTADTLNDNCMTLNGQYGFQATSSTNNWNEDRMTGGPYGITVSDNEISYNDTCDYSGRMNNKAVGWTNVNPVPPADRNPECGSVTGDGDQGGFKLWETNGVTISGNFIHNNWGPGGWADTNNANTTWLDNTIMNNESAGIMEEVSYNFAITGNYIANNNWVDGLNNAGFPAAAIYVSESGSDTEFGGVPACSEASCAKQPAYVHSSPISGNTFVNNGGSVFLWQSSNRFCSDGFDAPCTLVDGGRPGKSPFTVANCKANLPKASVNLTTFAGNKTGSPAEDWWNGCRWRTENVTVTGNTFDFNPAQVPHCNSTAWPDCGAGGVFSQYATPTAANPGGWVVPTQITFFQGNVWARNHYYGKWDMYAWNQGNGDNPVTWSDWTKALTGDKCTSAGQRQSGACTGPFGQDVGSTYRSTPLS